MYLSDLKFFSSKMLAIYRSYSKHRDEIKVMYEMHTSTDLSSAISEFQEQQFSILIVGPRGILSEEKRIWSKKEMLHLFHVHFYLAPDDVSVGVAFPPFLIPFPPGLYKHSLRPEGDLNLKGAGIFVQKLKLNPYMRLTSLT